MTRTHKLLGQTVVLLTGLCMAFVVTLLPLFSSSIPRSEIILELTTGAGVGFISTVLPYIVFWILTHQRISTGLFYSSGFFLVALGVVGTAFLLSTTKDPMNAQAGIGYLYILIAQALVLAFLFIRMKK